MKSFFKYVLATITGLIITGIIGIFVVLGIFAAMISSVSSDKEVAVPANSVLYVTLNHQISDRSEKNPFEMLDFQGIKASKSIGLNDILARISYAKTDNNIKGIYLNLSSVSTGFASLQEIRDALVDFKKSGKFIVSYGEVYTQKAYYLASVADKIYLNPQGALDFKGLSSSTMFMKEALDKMGVEMQIVKVGTFKSAVEPFILKEMSAPNREQVQSYLGSIYQTFLASISESRKISVESLAEIANDYKIRAAKDAVDYKFADALMYKDELLAELKKRLNVDEKKDISAVSLVDYKPNIPSSGDNNTRIALLYAEGEITSGESVMGKIGSETISRELRKLRNDQKVKAVVFRVNSPGGSALASDVIWREVELLKKVKPVIVSMGDVAASGGYYIAAAADSIFAENNTITGSIGVFGMIPNLQNLLNNKIGFRFDGVKTGKYADLLSNVDRPMTADERLIIQTQVNSTYQTFMQRVSDGRKVSLAHVDSVGQGRVWTGRQALDLGLVDKIGGIDAAIAAAASKAKISDYKLVEYPAIKDPFANFLGSSVEKIKVWFAQEQLGESYRYFETLKSVTENSGIQAKLPYEININ